MKRLLFAALIVLAGACRKPAPAPENPTPTKAVAAGASLIEFDGPDGSFSCLAPADWKAVEDKILGPLVTFYEPTSSPRAFVSISVALYPGRANQIRTPQAYWNALDLSDQKPSPLATRVVNGHTTYELYRDAPQYAPHGSKVLYMKHVSTVLIPTKDGFFELTHTAPLDNFRRTISIFEAVTQTFRPKI